MSNKEYLNYRNFMIRLSKAEKEMVYGIIGYCVDNKKLHPVLTNEVKPQPNTILSPYSRFSDEQKATLLSLVIKVMQMED